jgi:hypothetical protein
LRKQKILFGRFAKTKKFKRLKSGIKFANEKMSGIKFRHLAFIVLDSYKKEIGIMTAKAKIKVIKKSEVKTVEVPVKAHKVTKQQAAREMVSTVSTWVNEFQQRRRFETKQAIEKFLSNKPQTNGV